MTSRFRSQWRVGDELMTESDDNTTWVRGRVIYMFADGRSGRVLYETGEERVIEFVPRVQGKTWTSHVDVADDADPLVILASVAEKYDRFRDAAQVFT